MNYCKEAPDSLPGLHLKQSDEVEASIFEFTGSALSRMHALIVPLLTLRHELFDVKGTEYVKELTIIDQLYDDPSYNVGFISHDMGLRNGNALEYHQTTERYDKGYSEENAKRDFMYRQAILAVAQELGFISRILSAASNPIDRNIGILDSQQEVIQEPVAAIVINGAAGMSNVKRVRDAIRNIESGAISTDRIILTAGTRVVGEAEKERMKPPYIAGNTEYESLKLAAQQLLDIDFEDDYVEIPVEYGDGLTAKVEQTVATIGGRSVIIEAVEAPFDDRRLMADGSNAKRINTEEAFMATLPLLEGHVGEAIVMESHDTWISWQNLIANEVYGLQQSRTVYPAGPFNDERVYVTNDNEKEITEIHAPQDVIDEIIKTYKQLVKIQMALRR